MTLGLFFHQREIVYRGYPIKSQNDRVSAPLATK